MGAFLHRRVHRWDAEAGNSRGEGSGSADYAGKDYIRRLGRLTPIKNNSEKFLFAFQRILFEILNLRQSA
jgi:hypothetical protein